MNSYKVNKFFSKVKIKPKTGALLIFFSVLCFGLFIVHLRAEIINKNRYREMSSVLHFAQINIQQTLTNSFNANLTLGLTINNEGVPQNFEKVAKKILDQNPSIDLVQLVPKGVITHVYPKEGNESVLGFNVLDTANNPIVWKEANKAIANKKLFFAGPVELKQGGIGIIGRLPIYKHNEFWGFSAVIIRIETLVKSSGIDNIKNEKYYFQLSKKNPNTKVEKFFLENKSDFKKTNFLSVDLNDKDWKLYIIEKKRNNIWMELIPSLILALLLSITASFFAYYILKRPAQLTRLVNLQAKEIIKTESLFKTIFDKAAVGIAQICVHQHVFVNLNVRFAEILGYSLEELKTKTLNEITHECDFITIEEKERALKIGTIEDFTLEIRLKAKNNSEIWVNLIVSKLSNSPITSGINIAIIEDITEKKQRENQIIESNKRLKSLFDDSPIPIWEEDFSAVKKYLKAIDLIGKSKKEIETFIAEHPYIVFECVRRIRIININQKCLVLYEADSAAHLIENFDSIMSVEAMNTIKKQIIAICKNKSSFATNTKIITLNGVERNIHLQWNVISGFEESLERVITTTEDITDRISAQNEQEESERKLTELINSIDGIVWEYAPDTKSFNFISDKVEHILGYSKANLLENEVFWEENIFPDDRATVLNNIKALNDKNNYLDCEYRMTTAEGKTIWVRDIVNYVKNKTTKKKLIRGVIFDVTKSKHIEENLNQSLIIVTEQNRRLFNFSHIVSHNLRSHTSNIQSIINLLEITTEPKEQEELLSMLKIVSTDLDDSIHNLNEITTIYTNINVERQKIQLKLAVENVLLNLSNSITLRKAKITNHITNKTIILHNKSYLDNIVKNFLFYILKNKDLKTIPKIELKSYEEENYVVLEIKNIGGGLNIQKNNEKIFSLFHPIENDDNLNHGFGLFIAKSQIETLNGKIEVESSNDNTTFKIYFK